MPGTGKRLATHGLTMRAGTLVRTCGGIPSPHRNRPKNIGLSWYRKNGKTYTLSQGNLEREVTCQKCLAYMEGGEEIKRWFANATAARLGRPWQSRKGVMASGGQPATTEGAAPRKRGRPKKNSPVPDEPPVLSEARIPVAQFADGRTLVISIALQ